MNEEEAIGIIKKNYEDARGSICFRDDIQAVDTLEDYIKNSKNLINKQEKVIDRMAEYIEIICKCSETARDVLYGNNYEIYLEKPSKFSKEEIKEYFMEDKE